MYECGQERQKRLVLGPTREWKHKDQATAPHLELDFAATFLFHLKVSTYLLLCLQCFDLRVVFFPRVSDRLLVRFLIHFVFFIADLDLLVLQQNLLDRITIWVH